MVNNENIQWIILKSAKRICDNSNYGSLVVLWLVLKDIVYMSNVLMTYMYNAYLRLYKAYLSVLNVGNGSWILSVLKRHCKGTN